MLFSSFSLSREKSAHSKKMLINVVDPEESRIAIIDTASSRVCHEISDGKAAREYYKGVVPKDSPSFRAAFVDLLRHPPRLLPLDEVHPTNYSVSGA